MLIRARLLMTVSLLTLAFAACGGNSTGPGGMPDDDPMMSVADDQERY